jgi:hypothetical protein
MTNLGEASTSDAGLASAAATARELIADGMRIGLGNHGESRWLVDRDAAALLEGR